MSPRRLHIFAVATLLIALACACSFSTIGDGGAPTSAPGGEGSGAGAITLIDEQGQEVQVQPEPPDFVEVMLERVENGEITLQEGVISSLQVLTGEKEASEIYGDREVTFEFGWGLSNLAVEAYESSSDDAERAEIERLYNIFNPPQENLDLYAAPDDESWQPPQIAMLGIPPVQPSVDCRAIASRGFPADAADPPVCLLVRSFNAGGNRYRVYFPIDRRGDATLMSYVDAAETALRDSQARLEPYSDVRDINVVFTLLPGPSAGIVAGVPGLVDSPGSPGRACPVSVFPSATGYPFNDFQQILAHEIFHCISYWRKGTTGWRASFWYQEGMAEHFSNVVYPGNNLEIRERLHGFDTRSADTWLMGMTYSNFIFFQYLENRFGNEYILSLHDDLPSGGSRSSQAAALASMPDMQAIFHDFGKAYLNREIIDSDDTDIPNQVYYLPENDIEIGEGRSLFIDGEVFTISRYRLQFDDGIEYEIFKEISGSDGEVSWKKEGETTYTEIPDEVRIHCEEPQNYIVLLTTAPPGASSGDTIDVDMEVDIAEDGRMDCCLVGTWEQETFEIRSHLEQTLPPEASITDLSGTFLMSIDDERFIAFAPENYQGTVVLPGQDPVTVRVEGASTGTFILPDDEPGVIRSVEETAAFVITLSGVGGTISYPLESSGPLGGADSFRYTCSATTLTSYTGDVAPFSTSTFTRVSDVPQTPPPPEELPVSPGGGDDGPTDIIPGDSCTLVTLNGFSSGSGSANWTLTNESTEVLEISSVYLDWPSENGNWEGFELNGAELWSGSQSPSPGLVDSGWSGDRSIAPGIPNSLTLSFANDSVGAAGYILVIEFSNGCFANDVR